MAGLKGVFYARYMDEWVVLCKTRHQLRNVIKLTYQVLDKLKLKMGKDYDFGVGKGSTFILELDTKFEDKVLEMLINNRINVQGA